jgi:hypothetical protein
MKVTCPRLSTLISLFDPSTTSSFYLAFESNLIVTTGHGHLFGIHRIGSQLIATVDSQLICSAYLETCGGRRSRRVLSPSQGHTVVHADPIDGGLIRT